MEVYITDARRTPVGVKGGVLAHIGAAELAAPVLAALHAQTPGAEEVILGNVTGPGGNIARLASLTAGLPAGVPGVTIDRQCASGLEAVRIGAALIHAGAIGAAIAGGCESTSTSPRPGKAVFSPAHLGDPEMGAAAEALARREGITRAEQDAYAHISYERFARSVQGGLFQEEIIPVSGCTVDEAALKKRPVDKLIPRAKAVFEKGGTVTALNASAFNDAACAVYMTGVKQPGLQVMASAVAGGDPKFPAAAPVPAIQKLLEKTGLSAKEIDVWEINEAFAVKIVYIARKLDIPLGKINPDGGGLALGHPYGASGAMLVLRLFQGMRRRSETYGIAAVGSGGGLGTAVLFKQAAF